MASLSLRHLSKHMITESMQSGDVTLKLMIKNLWYLPSGGCGIY